MKYSFFLCFLLSINISFCQTGVRRIISENEAWQFTKDAFDISDANQQVNVKWQPVTLPHTWNVDDVMDDSPGYFRGVGWYRKMLVVSDLLKSKDVFLYFEGANQVTEVFVNGKKAGEHTGGYTGFCISISRYLKFDGKDNRNEIVVKVDNSHNLQVPPLSADFTFYGGIYRDLYLVAADPVHFSFDRGSMQGVFISTPSVDNKSASVHIKGNVSNNSGSRKLVKISTQVLDKERKIVGQVNSRVTVLPGDHFFEQNISSIVKPHLWSPEDPYLYTVISSISDAGTGKILDKVSNSMGFRWFHFDAEKGFFLNGHPYKLVGASRHQDLKGVGNALTDDVARRDLELLKKMGGNFLRVAHYPQDPSVLQTCDQLGLLASVEIPVVNEITESDSFYRNCEQMQIEMIRQHYNHPSIIVWCYMNEILLRSHFDGDKERQKLYYAHVLQLAQRLDSITRKEDPYRYTMIANHGDLEKYKRTGLTGVPGIIGWNLYQGWYGGKLADFSNFLDNHQKTLPGRPFVISEYGSDADPRIRSFNPVRFDKSVEYTTAFHQYYLDAMLTRPFVAGAIVWNLADFNSESRIETMPHINNKGLLMWDRGIKDPYYFYQAKLLKQPFIKISSSYWDIRSGVVDDSVRLTCLQPVQVASNLDSVTFWINGSYISTKSVENGLCVCPLPFVNGVNTIEVKGVSGSIKYSDVEKIHFDLLPSNLKDERLSFRSINILLGAKRIFFDMQMKQVWLPDQAYKPGSWGSIGGQPFQMPGNKRLPYGTDKNITGTDNDPVYQTQQTGIEQYKLDVPDGEYEVILHFAELLGGKTNQLIYNLSDAAGSEESVQRVFNVSINDLQVLYQFDIARQYGVSRAVAKKFRIPVADQTGIRILFDRIKGEPVLNAIQVKRIF